MNNYRGNEIISFEVLAAECEVCQKVATVRVTRDNHTPPPGYVKGGSITSYYCDEHQPNSVRHTRNIENWIET